MKKLVILMSLAVLSGCGGAGKGFDRFACMSRNLKGEPPCPPPADGTAQNAQ